jgi:hypothetical protein
VTGVAVALSLAGVPAALAARTTTVPGNTIQVYFIFYGKKLVYGIYREGPGGANDLYLGTSAQRGDYAIFYVLNRTHQTHSFVFMKKTLTVKPGQKDHLFARALLARGGFPFASPSNPGKAYRGVFRVY